MQQYMLLQRNLVYTGIARGKKLVVLIGSERRWQWRSETTGPRTGFQGC